MFKSSSILLTYAGESHGEILFFSLTWVNHMEKFFFFPLNIRVKLLFSFSLHGSCGGPKRVLFFSLVTWHRCGGPIRVLFFSLVPWIEQHSRTAPFIIFISF
jgi:hypothetical protein